MRRATKVGKTLLHEFLMKSVARGSEGIDTVRPRDDVTVLMYFFWNAEDADQRWPSFEGALLETWRNCGRLKTAIVTNSNHRCVIDFAGRFDNVEVQVESRLIPGKLESMSIDCLGRLHTRFATPHVLIVQDDGFPLRRGLDEFVGKYDYVGAPWVHHNTYYDLYPYRYCVGNGGFSLRSRRICEAASRYYQKFFKWMPYWWYLLGDDTFYCKTLRFWFPSFRRQFVWASAKTASKFSVECNVDFLAEGDTPIGFHGKEGWRRICAMVDLRRTI